MTDNKTRINIWKYFKDIVIKSQARLINHFKKTLDSNASNKNKILML